MRLNQLTKRSAAVVTVTINLLAAAVTVSAALSDPAVALNRKWAAELFSSAPDQRLPFSFVYDRKPSSEFLRHWTRKMKDERISDTTSRRTLTLSDPAGG
jgi:hypothetical protein